MLEAELDESLGYTKNGSRNKNTNNERNGYSQKTVKNQFGELELDIPRDWKAKYEPKIVPKYKRDISGLDEKIIFLCSREMTIRDILDQLKDLYEIDVSAEMISKISERLIAEIKEWQCRTLERTYPFAFIDVIHYKIRDNGHILKPCCCCIKYRSRWK